MLKKGQISIFIIIAIVILVVIVVYIFIDGNEDEINVNPEVRLIYDYVNGCLNDVGEEAIYYVGQTGGYFGTANVSYQDTIAYYLYENENYMPSKEKIEEQIGLYMNLVMPFCLDGFESFPDFTVDEGEFNPKIIIENEKVVFDVSYVLSISKENNVYSFDKFKTEIPSRLGIIIKAVEEYMDRQMIRTDAICASCLYDVSDKYEVYFNILETEQSDSVLIVARDEKIKILDEEYIFYFVNKLEDVE